MVSDSARELGRFIGRLASSHSRTNENLEGDEAHGGLLINNSDRLVVNESGSVTKKTVSGVFIVGHPVYGEVSNCSGSSGYPVGMPLILDHPVYGFLDCGFLGDDVSYEEEVVYTF